MEHVNCLVGEETHTSYVIEPNRQLFDCVQAGGWIQGIMVSEAWSFRAVYQLVISSQSVSDVSITNSIQDQGHVL